MNQKLLEIFDLKLYRDPRLKEALADLRAWMGPLRGQRPEGYLNLDKYFSAYNAYYLPLHLPELYWILEQAAKKDFSPKPRSVLDVGCGPGTLSLALFLYLQSKNLALPEKLVLWDHSAKALATAKGKLLKIAEGNSTKIFAEKVKLPSFVKNNEKFDLIMVGHFLNEWGAGPRFREKKLSFLKTLLRAKLNDEGSVVVIEPPLRECTLDLMHLRDELARDFTIVAPCPQSDQGCPMLKDRLGWCYAQPPRAEFRRAGLAPVDAALEKLLKIKLTHPGFSYLFLTKQNYKAPPSYVCVSEQHKPGELTCEANGKIVERKLQESRGSIHRVLHDRESIERKRT